MSKSIFKRRWWVPLLVLFTPGICYFYAALIPHYDPIFFNISIVLVLAAVLLAVIRVLQPPGEASPNAQIVAAQIYTLAGLLISIRFGIEYLPTAAIFTVTMLVCAYLLAWSLPYIAPKISLAFHQEVWHPKTLLMRAARYIALGSVAAAGVIGAHLYRQKAYPVIFCIAFIPTLTASWFISTGILRLKRRLGLVPPDA